MYKLEDTLWWYVGMRRIAYRLMRDVIGPTPNPLDILDAGCGTGGAVPLLERFGKVTSFDFEPEACRMFHARGLGRILAASTDAIPFQDESFDLVTSFEVICQLPSPNDELAIEEMARVLRPGGTLLVRLPAIQALYGSHDITLHTKHRYSTKELASKIEKAGLQPLKTTYLNTFLFPVAATRRLVAKFTKKPPGESDVRAVSGPLNLAMSTLLTLEGPILQRTNLPIGLTVLALARKP